MDGYDPLDEFNEFDIRAYVGKRIACRFFMKTVVDDALTKENGYTSHREVPFAEIWQIGERDRWHVAAEEPYQYVAQGLQTPRWYSAAEIWSRQWAMFSADNSSDQIVGMRLEEWGRISRAEAADLKAMGIRTVEELAHLPEGAKKKLGFNANRFVEAAQRFVAETAGEAELEKRDSKIADLERQLHALAAKLGERAAPMPAAEAPDAEEAARGEFAAWPEDALKAYLKDNQVKVDNRWGVDRLRDEAAKAAARLKTAA